MEGNTTARPAIQFDFLGRPSECTAAREGARAMETRKLELSELLLQIFVRITVVVCLFGPAGCASPDASQTHVNLTAWLH